MGRMSGEAPGLGCASAVAEGWLCSSSVGRAHTISGTSLQQNYFKTERGRGILQRFVSLNVGRKGTQT